MSNVVSLKLKLHGGGICIYEVNPFHRNNNQNKSQWTITDKEEIKCFINANNKTWTNGEEAWGLHYAIDIDKNIDKVTYLGIGEDRKVNLFIAKFKNDVPRNTWHGYPADYQRKPQDIPDREILNNWIDNNVLPSAKIRKIMRGQPCKL